MMKDYDPTMSYIEHVTTKQMEDKIKQLQKENAKLHQQVNELMEALSSLLDGLDSNLDERCGLLNEEWEYRITTARQTLGSIRRQKNE